MQVVLVMLRGDGERRSFSIARDMTVIGRREDCDLRIPVGDVSRKHCRLVKEADTIRLEDLGSSNGTYVNGSRVQEMVLSPGDSIQVGPVQFVLQIDGTPSEDELARPRAVVDTAMAEPALDGENTLEEASAEEAIAAEAPPLEELATTDDLEEVSDLEEVGGAPPPPLPAPIPPAPPRQLAPHHASAETAAPSAGAGELDDWNFVMDEGESTQSHVDFNIDLDSPQQQPHGQA